MKKTKMQTLYYIYGKFPTKVYHELWDPKLGPDPQIATKFVYDSKSDLWYGLYAIALSKRDMKSFMKLHNSSYFHVIKRKVTKEELKEDNAKIKLYILTERMITSGREEEIPLLLAEHETGSIDEYMDTTISLMSEDSYDDAELFPPYKIFQEKYQTALEDMYYTTIFVAFLATELYGSEYEIDEETGINPETEIANDGMCYGLSYPSGKSIYLINNELAIYTLYYAPILSPKILIK